ncbi:MAG TPA: FecR family protein, partial [Polyangiaceae bacterium]
MTERKRGVEDVLESMGRMVVPLADEPDAQRARIVAALDDKLDATRSAQKSRRKSRWLLACAACVTLAAALSVGHSLRANKAPVAQVEPNDLVRRGDAIATAEREHRNGRLENGAALSVFPSTELTVSAVAVGGDELILDRGRIELKVPKLVAGRTLSVTTPDATVTVRGTRFAVEVTLLDSHPITRVDVSEGSVWVRTGSERLVLEAGTHWTSRAPEAPSTRSDSSASPANPALEASAPAPAVALAPSSVDAAP